MAVVMDGPLMERIIDQLLELQGRENFDLQLLKKQLREAEKGIENMLNAIQAGIITPSTKQRLMELENQKEQLEKQIVIEQIKHPVLSREQIACFINQYKKTDITDEAERQRLIDWFVNAVYVYDDKIVLTFNYKDGTKTVPLGAVNGSDMVASGPPRLEVKIDIWAKNPVFKRPRGPVSGEVYGPKNFDIFGGNLQSGVARTRTMKGNLHKS